MSDLKQKLLNHGESQQSAAIDNAKNMDDLYFEGFAAAVEILWPFVSALEEVRLMDISDNDIIKCKMIACKEIVSLGERLE